MSQRCRFGVRTKQGVKGMRISKRQPYTSVLGILLSLTLLLGACGGDDDNAQAEDDGQTLTDATQAGNGDDIDLTPTMEEQAFTVGQEIWHSGFRIEFGEGLSYQEERLSGNTLHYVSVEALFENLGEDEKVFSSEINLVSNGVAAIQSGGRESFPIVPGGLSSPGTVEYIVEPGFDFDNAELVVGREGEQQAKVPLGSGSEIVALAPAEVDLTGELSMELIDMAFTSANLRYDMPVSYGQAPEGKIALTINFDVTSRRDGNWNIFADDFALIVPDGTALAADGSMLHALPGSEPGTTTPDHSVRFLLDDPPAGDYVLRFTPGDPFIGEDGVTEATFDFTLS